MFRYVRWMALLSSLTAAPVMAATALQCVPYARTVSGIDIRGDAWTWWGQAEGRVERGHVPRKGAVIAFESFGPMRLGHVAVVSRIISDREILIRHANWSSPGAIEEDVLAIDVSDAGDWSQVRVWHSPTGQMGARTNPPFAFIYPAKAKRHPFTPDPALGSSLRYASVAAGTGDGEDGAEVAPLPRAATRMASVQTHAMVAAVSPQPAAPRRKAAPRIEADPFLIEYADNSPSDRSLGDVIADVKRESLMN